MSSLPPLELVETVDPIATPRRVALVRPDRRPAVRTTDEKYVMTFPNLILREVVLFQLVVIGLALAAIFFDAPLEGIANPNETPNPAKAPWYFLGLQELLHYFPPVVAGVLMPLLVIVALVVIPYARINQAARPLWSGAGPLRAVALAVSGGAIIVFFGVFGCWPIVIPTAGTLVAMFAARRGESAGRFRKTLARVTLPEWIMLWFSVVATVLTVIGTFFRGPGWTFVWPWSAGAVF
jgi:quinol-cytochrome oxidoreductase complex cytochrome b subunit